MSTGRTRSAPDQFFSLEADDQNHPDMEALASALRNKNAPALEKEAVATDHSFSDHRIALQGIVVRWLEKLVKSEVH